MHELRSLLPYLRRYRRSYLAGLLLMVWNITMTILGYQREERTLPGSAPALQPAE